ncbi:MAG: amino acid adenylation domain-containing protein [Lachnospiraceae bacterium]|nr:amino acid adenylation domain-containing protein [Lachnospiraceae bacterium]
MNFLEEFQQIVRKYPDKTAVVDDNGSRSATYLELDALSRKVAAKLEKTGDFSGKAVLVCMDRRMEYVAANIGIMMAGAAFVPLIPEYPEERIAYISKDCQAAARIDGAWMDELKLERQGVMTCKEEQGSVDGSSCKEEQESRNGGFCKEGRESVDGASYKEEPDRRPAMIIYTSGSTGRPKGIVHSMESLTQAALRMAHALSINENDVQAAVAPMSFVVIIMEYFDVLIKGGCIHIVPEEVRKDVRLLEEYYDRHKITSGFISPQMLRYFRNRSKSLKKIVTGSERVSQLGPDGYELYNVYGSSETASMISYYKIEAPMDNTPIGKAAEGVELFLLDEEGREVLDGEEGEICVKGILGECYLNLEEQSRRAFIPQEDGKVLVRTGDMGRKLPDGNLIYVNRKDWMVKINGQRVETGEIELRMAAVPGIRNAAVKAFADENGQNYLCGYYVGEDSVTSRQIREQLKTQLPAYMIPRFLKRLEELPKNVNGKLDRNALLPPGISDYKTEYQEPENETQRRICQGFEETLHCGTVGRTDDFFRLGGDSINVLKLAECLSGMSLTPEIVLKGRTPEKIAELLYQGTSVGLMKCGQQRKEYPLTDSQTGVYLACVNEPESLMYNIPMCCELPEDIDLDRMKQAVRRGAAMHSAFGITVALTEGNPVMRLKPEFLKIQEKMQKAAKTGSNSPNAAELEAEIFIEEREVEDIEREKKAFVRPFHLEEGPLYRFGLYRRGTRSYFLFDVHHLIFDGTSVKVFLDEISLLYQGREPEPEELSMMDVAVYEETLKETPQYQAARSYFRDRLGEAEQAESLLKDFRPKSPKSESNTVQMSLGEELPVMEAEQFARQKGISENTLFLGAFAYALGKYTGENKSLFCTVNNGRHSVDLAESAGMFVRTLPVFQRWEETSGIEEYLLEFQENFFETMSHDCISFGELAKDYGIASDVMFVYQGEMLQGLTIQGKQYQAQPISRRDVQADISVMVIKRQSGYEISLEYRKDLYREETARGLLRMLAQTLKGMVSCETLREIPLASEQELRLLDRFNETEDDFDRSKTIVDLFREQAKRVPDHTAVVYKDRAYTYGQIDELTDRIAAYLESLGIGQEQVVSVLIPRCEYMAIASLGISKAGAAYQPLDATYPKERLEFMMQDGDAKLLIAEEDLLRLVPGYQGKVLLTKDIPNLPRAERLPKPPKPEDLFILLYTSGSTGAPKGCMIEHGNLAAFCHWYQKYYQMSQESRTAAYASYGFDAHMMDLYPALTLGAQAHIIEEAIRLDLKGLNQYFKVHGITHIFMTTQIGRAFATSMKDSTLQHLSMGGESLAPFAPEGAVNYYNVYGPTECTILSTVYPMKEYEEEIPIGKALSNLKLYVLDQTGRRVPAGVPGELCIAGYQVSRGYLNRPEKTAEVYSDNPFCQKEGYRRMYHTGDVARFLPDGNIQFIGRRDGQVKIRGFRIELAEIEEIIRRFPGIKDAAVAAFDEPAGGKYVAAYVVSDETVDIEALHGFIEESKPPYMVPAVTMQIEKIPLNQNQKVDKRALPVPERKQEAFTAPKGERQQKIFDCIAEVIGHREFGAATDIYRAGLTSIGAVKLNVLLSEAFAGAVIRSKDLKENNTVEKLEHFLLNNSGEEIFEIQKAYPLTQTQNGIFVECAANLDSTIYNIPFLFRLGEQVDLHRLKQAVEQTVEAHPYIKTRLYMDENGDIWQERRDDAPFEAEIKDSLNREELVRPYQLLGGQLFRISLYDDREGKYLFLEFHHIISDGTSCGIFIQDMNRAYAGEALKKERFSGYEAALLEQKARKGREYQKAKEYYDSIFQGCDTDFLPAKDGKEQTKTELLSGCGADVSPSLGMYRKSVPADMEKLSAFCREHQITMNALFTGAFGFVTGRYVYKDEAVFTTIYNGRSDSRLSSAVSMLVKTLPVFCSLEGEQEVAGFLKATGDQLVNSMSHDIYSFGEISRAYGIQADLMFAFQGDDFQFEEIAGEKAVMEELKLDTAKAPLSVDVAITGTEIQYQAEYRSDLYEEAAIAGMMDSLNTVVFEMLKKQKLKEISMVSQDARRELDGYNETDYPVEQTTANLLFERQVQLHPEKTAVIANGKALTFCQLNENANKVANRLLELGLQPESMVGVMLPRTVDVYAVRQGVMKAGGAFLPIDPEYPDERISYILEDSGAEFVIMPEEIREERSRFAEKLPVQILILEELLAEGGNTENPGVKIRPEQLCYCIYTSGSTGKPKGVMIEHRNLVNYVDNNRYNVEAQSYVRYAAVSLAFAAITFDVSVLEECIPLYHGITVCMANEEEIHNPIALSKLIQTYGVDMMTCTPSFLINIIDLPETREALSGIKVFNVGAEAFPAALYQKIKALGTNAVVFNGYGPTETTIGCAFDQVTGDKITIGKPMANIKMVTIDKYRNLLPAGAPGELLIIGNGVGRGYVGKPELTADKFIAFEGRKAYRSGDLARWNHHGKIEFMGRMDNQVKLRGLRVELDEIEHVINQYPGVKSSVVLVKEKDSVQFLCGYFVAESQVDKQNLTGFMQKYLTPYMVPSVLMQLEELPLTNNGKVNKKALPEPEYVTEHRNYVKPRTRLQRRLCEIFAMALGAEKIGIEDDFFENGGTSLSASKVAMKCMSAGIPVSYGDLFDHKTPLSLERLIQEKEGSAKGAEEQADGKETRDALEALLQQNTLEHLDEIASVYGDKPSCKAAGQTADRRNILLTGATGFLGAHILRTVIESSEDQVYCLLRKGSARSLETRLKGMLVYYFSNPYEELFGSRIFVIEGDITDAEKVDSLAQYDFAQVINCAACVKHFSADDTLERVNYQGVLNLIRLCEKTGRELIQISTVSIAGENEGGMFPPEKKLHENELFFGQSLNNRYIDTKFRAEKAVLEAVSRGMKGKVIRVGNLMSRVSDGEFQINSVTNGFMRTLRGYVALGKFPVSLLDMPAEFSPIDATAEAIVKLAKAAGGFTVFHAYSSYLIQMADVVEQMNSSGIPLEIVSDREFQEDLQKALADEKKNELISGLIAYLSSDKDKSSVYIDGDNSFTTKALYRLGFKWPLPDGAYLRNAFKALETLGFFDGKM